MEIEKQPEQQFIFPRISKIDLDKFDLDFDKQQLSPEDMIVKMVKEDEVLGQFIYSYSTHVEDPDIFIENAYYVFEVLKTTIDKNGQPLPKVSPQTFETFYHEGKYRSDMINYVRSQSFANLPREEQERILLDLMAKVDEPSEYIYPDPYNYCEENPALMVKIAAFSFDLPGMLVYELKRRQYISDLLERKLFPGIY